MFNNIGKKIKSLARILCILGIICSIIIGIVLIKFSSPFAWPVMIVGSLLSWIESFFTYGFGELIDKTSEIAKIASFPDNSFFDKKED